MLSLGFCSKVWAASPTLQLFSGGAPAGVDGFSKLLIENVLQEPVRFKDILDVVDVGSLLIPGPIALVIGVDSLGPLSAERTTGVVASVLEKSGFMVVRRLNLSATDLDSALHRFRRMITPGCTALFYFCGSLTCGTSRTDASFAFVPSARACSAGKVFLCKRSIVSS